MYDRFNQRCQRNGEEHAPEPPQAAENHHRENDHQRMQVYRLGEQHRHQQIAIQPLNNQVDRKQAPELGPQAKLEQRHADHRDGHYEGTNVGNQYRQPHQHRQQQRIVEAKHQEAEPGGDPHHDHLQHLAANVVGDLLVHLFPHLPR